MGSGDCLQFLEIPAKFFQYFGKNDRFGEFFCKNLEILREILQNDAKICKNSKIRIDNLVDLEKCNNKKMSLVLHSEASIQLRTDLDKFAKQVREPGSRIDFLKKRRC